MKDNDGFFSGFSIFLHFEISHDGSRLELIRARYIDERYDVLVNLRLEVKD